MAGKRISKWENVGEALSTDEFLIARDGLLKKATLAQAQAFSSVITGGSASGSTVLRFGEDKRSEGWHFKVFDKTVDLHTTPSGVWSLGFTLPENCVLVNSQFKLIDAITGAGGAIAISLGKDDPGTETEGGETVSLAAGQQGKTKPGFWLDEKADDPVALTIKLFATNGAGARTGTIGGGAPGTERVRVRMIYWTLEDLV